MTSTIIEDENNTTLAMYYAKENFSEEEGLEFCSWWVNKAQLQDSEPSVYLSSLLHYLQHCNNSVIPPCNRDQESLILYTLACLQHKCKKEFFFCDIWAAVIQRYGFNSQEDLWTAFLSDLITTHFATINQWNGSQNLPYHSALEHVVCSIKFPKLGKDDIVLGKVLSLIFPLIETTDDAVQSTGLRALCHIVKNITPTQLRWYNVALLQVLQESLYVRTASSLEPLLQCICDSIPMLSTAVDEDVDASDNQSSLSADVLYDRFVPRILNDLNLAVDSDIKLIYVNAIDSIISQLHRHVKKNFALPGLPFRYVQTILRVLDGVAHRLDVPLLLAILASVKSLIGAAEPIIPHYVEDVVAIVLRIILFTSMPGSAGIESSSSSGYISKKQVSALTLQAIEVMQKLHSACSCSNETNLTAVPRILKQMGNVYPGFEPFCSQLQQQLPNFEI